MWRTGGPVVRGRSSDPPDGDSSITLLGDRCPGTDPDVPDYSALTRFFVFRGAAADVAATGGSVEAEETAGGAETVDIPAPRLISSRNVSK